MMKKICHFTTVHFRYDTRIFYRECKSIAKKGFETLLYVADDKEAETIDGVNIRSIGKPKNRFTRILFSTFKMFLTVQKEKADIYHFHDPELIFVGFLLKLKGKKVIYDIHENIIDQIKTKDWIPFKLNFFFSKFYSILIPLICQKIPLILAENSYLNDYQNYSKRLTLVLNKPELTEFIKFKSNNRKRNDIFYIGSITLDRGFDKFWKVMDLINKEYPKIKMHLIGKVELPRNILYQYQKRENIIIYGRKSLKKGYEISRKCGIGISILLPTGNYLKSYSTKIFEYMAIRMPFIVSDFPLYNNVVKKPQTGLTVDSADVNDIVEKILLLIKDRKLYKEIQQNQKEFIKKFNWRTEEKKLFNLYDDLLE
mgnify:CR=1 FL=1